MKAVQFARTRLDKARFQLYQAARVRRTCLLGGQLIKVEAGTLQELNRVHRYLTGEPDTIQWITEYVRPGDVFYDVGANIGLYSIFAAKKLGGDVKVYSFEPESQNYASLNRNVYLNGLSDSIATLCVALTDSSCVGSFYVRNHLRAGEATHQFGAPMDDQGNAFLPVHQQGMIGLSLDDLCTTYGIPMPNHMKIDVDGHEAAVIKGANRVLQNPSLKTVLLEITNAPSRTDCAEDILNRFRTAGFSVLKKAAITTLASNASSYNVIFVRPEQ